MSHLLCILLLTWPIIACNSQAYKDTGWFPYINSALAESIDKSTEMLYHAQFSMQPLPRRYTNNVAMILYHLPKQWYYHHQRCWENKHAFISLAVGKPVALRFQCGHIDFGLNSLKLDSKDDILYQIQF